MGRFESRIVGAYAVFMGTVVFNVVPGILAGAAGFSAYLTLRQPLAGRDIEHMFHLKFAITRPMIVALVAVGWPALVLCQYWLATTAANAAYGGRSHVAQTA